MSCVPIPPEVIYSVKGSMDSSLASRFLSHQPIGRGSFPVGIGRKTDPEPGRCRRTDGKKWRCSKEAHPDSKYCERHMRRGRNSSRKPVELSSSSPTTTKPFKSPSLPIQSPSCSYSISKLSSSMSPDENTIHSNARPPVSLMTCFWTMQIKGTCRGRDWMTVFFAETSGTTRSSQDYNCTNSSYGRYCQSKLQSFDDNNTKQKQHCFVLGSDFSSIKIEKDSETQKPLPHFFEEWPTKRRLLA